MSKSLFLLVVVSLSLCVAVGADEDSSEDVVLVCPDCGRQGEAGQTSCYFDGSALVRQKQEPEEAEESQPEQEPKAEEIEDLLSEEELEEEKEQPEESKEERLRRLEREIEEAAEEDEKEEQEFLLLSDPEFFNDDVESFYADPGFQLLPQSGRFVWRNILRNSIFYNSNVFIVNDEAEAASSAVYSVDLETILSYRKSRNLEIQLAAALEYQHFFDEQIDDFLPRASINVKYRRGRWYFLFQDNIAYSNVLLSGEENDFSSWVRNNAEGTVGTTYQRLLFEVTTFHQYQDFSDINGDYQFYGQQYTLGYKVSPEIYAIAEYGWDQIAYKEDNDLGQELEDTFAHNFLAGIRLNRVTGLIKSLSLSIAGGYQYRDSEYFFIWEANVGWKPLEFDSRRWRFDLSFSQRTKPSLLGNFRYEISSTFAAKYLFTPRLATIASFSAIYTDPDEGDSAIVYSPTLRLTYRFYRGVDAEVFSRTDIVTSKEEQQEAQRYLLGGSLVITF